MAPKRRNLDEDVSRTKKKKPNGKSTTNKTSLSPTQTATTGNTPAQEKSDQAHTSSQTATIVAAVIQELEDRGVIPKKQTVSNNGHIINCHHELQVPNHITNANQPQMEILDDATNVVQSVLQLPGMPNPQVSPRTMNGTPRQDHTGGLSQPAFIESATYLHSKESVTDLSPVAQRILSNALSEKTKCVYFSYWLHYVQFCREKCIAVSLPISVTLLVEFLAHLFAIGYKPTTILSHVSAFTYCHKMLGYPDFHNSFLVKQFLKGINKASTPQSDSRLPITYNMLCNIIKSLQATISIVYERLLFKAMCLLAFHGFFRVGELCVKTQTNTNNVLQLTNVSFINNKVGLLGVEIKMKRYKHSTQPVTLFIPSHPADNTMCPVLALHTYLLQSKHTRGPLFQLLNGQFVTYAFFNKHLHNVLHLLKYDTNLYKSHSFRIGAATYAFMQGHSEESIKRMGRWKSNALQYYVRLPVVSMPK